MTAPTVHFYFDFSCPYAYLASTAIQGVAARTGADLVIKPFLLGGVFRARNVAQNLASTLSPEKAAHNLHDMQRGSAHFGVPLVMPAGHPQSTVTALRVLLAHHHDQAHGDAQSIAHGRDMLPLMHRLFRAYWVDSVDISKERQLRDVLLAAGLDADALLAAAGEPRIKDELRARTDEAIEVGVFGAPAMRVWGRDPSGDAMEEPALFWGQDRLPHVERALGGVPDEPGPNPDGPAVDVWFDFSSPFAYLGVSRAREFLGDRVRWRPMLLGALFKQLGGPLVPLLSFNAAKQAWIASDLRWQAAEAGVPLRWPTGFPVRTVLALRVTLLVLNEDPDKAEALIHRVFRAVWADDEDPSSPAVIVRCCADVGLDGDALVLRAGESGAKHALFEATGAAAEAGVFGAPSFVVDPDGDSPALYWGNDRLGLAANC